MRLGGPVFGGYDSPDAWVAQVRRLGYRAASCPVDTAADNDTVKAYERAAAEADIVIAEVGAWSNPISYDDKERGAALAKCKSALDLADRIGARCCVNVVGSRSDNWAGPHIDSFTDETIELVVDSVREIVDAVKPTRTFWTIETMPWIIPDSPDSYLALLDAIDRDRVAVHFDPVNMISNPRRYCDTTSFLRECFEKLGPRIKSCHAKDIVLRNELTVHLSEALPGEGALDYAEFLRQVARLKDDVPIMLEHLATPEEYDRAASYIRHVAATERLVL